MRKLSGLQLHITYIYIVILGLFHLYTAAFGSFESYLQRNIHLAFVLPLAYWLFPYTPKRSPPSVPLYAWLLGAPAAAPYPFVV